MFSDTILTIINQYSNKSVFIVGDVNIDILDVASIAEFSNVRYSYNFFPLINIPTRVTDNTASCLDHIWYNNFNSLISGSFLLDVCDHYPVFTTLNFNVSNDPIKVHFRDHEHLNKLIVSMNAFQLKLDIGI